MSRKAAIIFLILFLLSACAPAEKSAEKAEPKPKLEKKEIKLSSPAFSEGERIPASFTCDGAGTSIPLRWTIVDEAVSYALIMDDPDAPGGTYVHWVVYNIPAQQTEILEPAPAQRTLETGAKQGFNDEDKIGYSGPCPPSGKHRYSFKIYALNSRLEMIGNATKQAIVSAMKGKIVAQDELVGTYER